MGRGRTMPYWNKVEDLKSKGWSWKEIAEELQRDGYYKDKSVDLVARNTCRLYRYHKYESTKPVFEVTSPEHKSFEYHSSGECVSSKVIEIKNADNITPNEIMVLHGLDEDKWEVVSYKNNFWQTQQKGGEVIDLYQSKLTVKPKECILGEKEIDALFEKLDRKFKTFKSVKPLNVCEDNKLIEINMSDVHLGRYYFDDINNIRYNSEYIAQIWHELIQKIVSKLDKCNPELINFVWCNDFFNSDGKGKTTTGGTPQDTDLDWQELFNLGVELLIEAIENLKVIAPITILYTSSNHDEMVSWYAVRFLEAWFKNDERVGFDTRKSPRKYVVYGNTLIGYGHGDNKLPPSKAASIMPLEASLDWSNTIYREFHLAHLHGEHMIEEINGVLVRRTSSPTFPDLYHIENGFLGNEAKVQLFIYDNIEGLETIHNIRVS